jgi:uncharacterized protein (DUF58 family)
LRAFRFILSIIIVLVAAQAFQMRLLFVLVYALAGVLVFAFIWAKLSLRWLEITRESGTGTATVGDYYVEEIRLRNRSPLPKLWLEVEDRSDLPGHHLNCVQTVRPLGTVSWRARTMCMLRGRYRLGPLTVTAGDPFGLFRVRREFPLSRPLTVYPPAFELKQFETLSGALPGGSPVNKTSYNTTPDFSGLREYRPGDSLNRIHWPSSARQNRLVVKEFEHDPIINVQIFLDMHEASHWLVNRNNGAAGSAIPASSGLRSPDSTEEYAVAAAATLSRHYLENHRSVGLISWGQHHEILPPDRGERQFKKIMEALAVIRAQGQSDFGQLIAAEVTRTRSSDTMILITSSPDEKWAGLLAALARRGTRMAVVLVEPATFGAPVDNSMLAVGTLAAMNVPVYLLKRGDDITHALDSELARLASRF